MAVPKVNMQQSYSIVHSIPKYIQNLETSTLFIILEVNNCLES